MPLGRRNGCRADVHHARAALDQRVQLAERRIGVGEREHRHADQAVAIREAPVLLEPAVECREARHRCRDVVPQRFFHAAAEGREQQHRIESLGVGDGDARVAVAVLGLERLHLEELGRVHALRNLAAEERVEAARDDDRVEGRIGDEAVDATADEELDALAVLHGANPASLEGLVEVPREGVERLVVVVVCVDRPDVHRCSSGAPCRERASIQARLSSLRRRTARRCRRARRRGPRG